MSQALGIPSDHSLILSLTIARRRIMKMLMVSLLAFSCSVQPTKPSDITLIDLKSQNVEKIRAGLESVLGNDSAGTAAMNCVTSYEDQLARFYPMDKNMIRQESKSGHEEEQYWEHERHMLDPPPPPPPSQQEAQERSQLQLFTSFSKGMLKTSMLRLNQCYESYMTSRNIGEAQMAFASGYIALTLGASGQIEEKMAALLDSLNARRPTKQ